MERTLRWGSHWRVLVDLATVIWLAVFFSSFSSRSPLDPSIADRIGLTLLTVFVADVGVAYYQANIGPSRFLRRHWVSVVMVIPYFRIFRVLRAVRIPTRSATSPATAPRGRDARREAGTEREPRADEGRPRGQGSACAAQAERCPAARAPVAQRSRSRRAVDATCPRTRFSARTPPRRGFDPRGGCSYDPAAERPRATLDGPRCHPRWRAPLRRAP